MKNDAVHRSKETHRGDQDQRAHQAVHGATSMKTTKGKNLGKIAVNTALKNDIETTNTWNKSKDEWYTGVQSFQEEKPKKGAQGQGPNQAQRLRETSASKVRQAKEGKAGEKERANGGKHQPT